MPVEPLYRAENLRAAYQLRYSWTGWAAGASFPDDILARVLPAVAPEWEKGGLRVLESALAPRQLQLTLSTTPQVAPVTLAARVKGRIQHHCRRLGAPIDFQRTLSVRSVGDSRRDAVEQYIRDQVPNEEFADERFREMMTAFTVVDPEVDLAVPSQTNSGRYWYNLHLVLVTSGRYRMSQPATLQTIRGTALRVCAKKGIAASRLAVLPDHLHLALRGAVDQTPSRSHSLF